MSNERSKVGMWGEPVDEPVELALEPRADQVVAPTLSSGQAMCAGCKRNLDAARMVRSHDAWMCKTCLQCQRATAPTPTSPVAAASGLVTILIGGAVGALVGAAIWAAIAVATELEVGYVAVLVGFLAGFGVRWGAGGQRGRGLQVVAATFAIAGMLAAKYFIFAYVMIQIGHKRGVDIGVFNHLIWSSFPTLLAKTVGPFDALFAFLAVAAAARACKPS